MKRIGENCVTTILSYSYWTSFETYQHDRSNTQRIAASNRNRGQKAGAKQIEEHINKPGPGSA